MDISDETAVDIIITKLTDPEDILDFVTERLGAIELNKDQVDRLIEALVKAEDKEIAFWSIAHLLADPKFPLARGQDAKLRRALVSIHTSSPTSG